MTGLARTVVLSLAGSVAVLLLLLFGAIFALDHGGGGGLVCAALSAKLKRPVTFTSSRVRLLSKDPTIVLVGLHVPSPPEITRDPLLDAGTVTLHLRPGGLWRGQVDLRAVEIDRATVRLVRLGHERNNYTFGHGGSGKLLGGTESFSITDSQWRMVDPERHVVMAGPMTHDGRPGAPWPLSIQGAGTVSEQPVTAVVRGGRLNGRKPTDPWPIDLQVQDGQASLHLSGQTQAPFDFRGFDLAVASTGPNLSVLGWLLRTEAPNSPPYRVTGRARRIAHVLKLTGLKATLGRSDVTGAITSDHTQARRKLTADLNFGLLQAADLAVLASPPAVHAQARSRPGVKPSGGEVLGPNKPFPVEALRRLDTEVDLRAARVEGYPAPLHDLRLNLRLFQGRLSARPIAFSLPAGRMTGAIDVDASRPIPTGAVNLKLQGARISAIRPKLKTVVDGEVDAAVAMTAVGRSPRAMLANATGRAIFLGHGSLQRGPAAAIGGDPLVAVAKGRNKAMAPIPCAFATFKVAGGAATIDRLLIVTPQGYSDGAGRLSTGDGRLDVRLQGHPSRRLTTATPPIVITGAIAHPKVSVSKAALATGAALSALTASFAALTPRTSEPAPRCAGLQAEAAAYMARR